MQRIHEDRGVERLVRERKLAGRSRAEVSKRSRALGGFDRGLIDVDAGDSSTFRRQRSRQSAASASNVEDQFPCDWAEAIANDR